MKNGQYRIGDAVRIVEVPAHTIRYWEQEFSDFLHPQRSTGNQRTFGRYQIELLLRIKKMLKEEKYSIAGARLKLQNAVIGQDEGSQEILMALARLIERGTDDLSSGNI